MQALVNGSLRTRPPLHIVVETGGRIDFEDVRATFHRNRGEELVADLLRVADLDHGTWKLKLFDKFKAGGHTPPIQVRKPTEFGVELRIRPAGNDSAVKASLVVPRDRGLSAQQVYTRLKAAEARERAMTPPARSKEVHVPINLTPAEAVRLLDAVHHRSASGGPYAAMDDFVEALADELGDADASYWLEAAERLVECGWLKDCRTSYDLTDAGRLALESAHLAAVTGQPFQPLPSTAAAPAAPAAPVASVTPPAATPPADPTPLPPVAAPMTEAGDVLLKVQERLKKLLDLAGTVATCRGNQREVLSRIGKLEHDLAAARAELDRLQIMEAEHTRGLPAEALQELLGPS